MKDNKSGEIPTNITLPVPIVPREIWAFNECPSLSNNI